MTSCCEAAWASQPLGAAAPAAPCASAAAAMPPPAPPAASNPNAAFLHSWRTAIQPKLAPMLGQLGASEVAPNLALAQVWTFLPVLEVGRQVLAAEPACLLGDPGLAAFHEACVSHGVPLTQLGPMGKVWESGAVQVVQDAQNLAADTHPCNRLGAGAAVADIVYLPVYDAAPPAPAVPGVVAVLELFVSAAAADVMVVANAISAAAAALGALGLSLACPGGGAPPRPGGLPRPAAAGGALGSRGSGSPAGGSASSAGSGGLVGGMARAPSVRALHTLQAL